MRNDSAAKQVNWQDSEVCHEDCGTRLGKLGSVQPALDANIKRLFFRWMRSCQTNLGHFAPYWAVHHAPVIAPWSFAGSRYVDGYYGDDRSSYVQNVPLRLTIENLAQELKDELDSAEFGVGPSGTDRRRNNDPPFYHEVAQHNRELNRHCHPFSANQPRTQAANYSCPAASSASSSTTRTNEEILNALKKIIERYERDDSEEEMIYEWRQVALAVDRILFWIFLVGTLSSTIMILIVAPITKVL